MFLPRRGNRTPNQMAAKFLILATVLCSSLCQWATATEDDSIRDAALKKLADQRKIIDENVNKLSFQAENSILIAQTNTRIEIAGALKQRAHFEMEQIGASYRFIAGLMNASKNVIHCMEETTQKAQNENQKYNYENCYNPIRDSHVEAGGSELDKMFEWHDKKNELLGDYSPAYDAAIISIKKSDSPSEIKSITENVIKKGEILNEAAKKAITEIRKIEMDQLLFMDDKVSQNRAYTRKSVDNLRGALENCFLTRTPFFNLRSIFVRDNLS